MSEVSNQQIYDLLLVISDDLAVVDTKTDELLLSVRAFNQELEAGRRQLAEARAVLAQQRTLLK